MLFVAGSFATMFLPSLQHRVRTSKRALSRFLLASYSPRRRLQFSLAAAAAAAVEVAGLNAAAAGGGWAAAKAAAAKAANCVRARKKMTWMEGGLAALRCKYHFAPGSKPNPIILCSVCSKD